MKLKWQCDQQAQIRLGIEPQMEIEIDIDLTQLTAEQRAKLAVGYAGRLVKGTQDEVAEELQKSIDSDATRKAAAEQELCDMRARIAASKIIPGNGASESFGGGRCTVKWPTWVVDGPYVSAFSALHDEAEAIIAPLRAEADRLTSEAKASAMADAQTEIDAAVKAEASASAAAEIEKAAKLAAKLARRAELGAVEIEITRGDRDWGTPWGAKVTGGRGKDDYDFDVASYDLGTEILTINCEPGDVIAWGQKNFRKPKRTLHERRRVGADWKLEAL